MTLGKIKNASTSPETIIKKEEMEKILSDNTINREEAEKIIRFIEKSASPLPEKLKTIIEKLKTIRSESFTLENGIKNDLINLTESVEIINGNFNMETLAKNNKSKFFNIVIGNKIKREVYSNAIVGEMISENIEYFPKGHNTIDVVFWKKIVDEIGIKSAGGMLTEKVAGFFQGIVKKVGSIGEKTDDKKEMGVSDLGNIIKDLKKLGDNPSEENNKKSLALIEKLKGYIKYMLKDYIKNLNTLIELGKEDKEGLKKLLDNPTALDSVLKTGKYNKDGYKIDLGAKQVSFAKNPNLEKSKKEFMKLAVGATNKSGGALEAVKKKVKEFAGFLKIFGLDANELREFRDSLKKIPIIGPFLFALVSFFLSDSLLNLMEGNPWAKEYKTSGKNFEKYIKNNKDKLPFSIKKEDFEDVEVSGSVEVFLENVNKSDKQNYENIQDNKELEFKQKHSDKEYKKETYEKLSEQKDFWKSILGDKEPSNPILKQLYKKAQEIKSKGKKLSAKEFFKELNKNLKIEITKKIIPETPEEIKAKKLQLELDKKLTIEDKDLLQKEIAKIIKFPAVIKIKDSKGIEKELNIDFKDKKLSINGKEFVSKNGDISSIKFDNKDVIIKITNKDGTENEKKITKTKFAELITGITLGITIENNILNLVTPSEKKHIMTEATIASDKQKIEAKKQSLEQEEQKLNSDIIQLEEEIRNINKELLGTEGVKGLNQEISNLNTEINNIKISIEEKKNKKGQNLDEIEKNNRKILTYQEEISKLGFYQVIDKYTKEGKIKSLEISNKKYELENSSLDRVISSLTTKLEELTQNLTIKKTEQSKKQKSLTEKLGQKDLKEKRVLEIKKELGESEKQIKSYEDKLEAEQARLEAEKQAEQARLEAEKQALEKQAQQAQQKVEQARLASKRFDQLLNNPAKIETNKLTLNDGTEITFNGIDNTINILNNKYGIKDSAKNSTLKLILKTSPFSFEKIYNSNNKTDFIKVLSDLKNNGKAEYSGLTFEKLN